jgi:transposase-like protein
LCGTRFARSTVSQLCIALDTRVHAWNEELLGLCLGDSESEATWTDLFAWLKRRGLHGVEVLVSDDHAGSVKAAQGCFQGVMWQRCQVHLRRHVLGRTPHHLQAQMAAGMRRIFQAADAPTARTAPP